MSKVFLRALNHAFIFFHLAQASITLEFYSDRKCQNYLETDNTTNFIDSYGCWPFRDDVLNVAGLLADFSSDYTDKGCKLNIYTKDDCSKASLSKIIEDGSSCADVSSAKGVGLDCPPGAGVDAPLATNATPTQDPSTVQAKYLPPITTPQALVTHDQSLTTPHASAHASGSSAMASSKIPQMLSQDLLVASPPASTSTMSRISISSESPNPLSLLTKTPTVTDSAALGAKDATVPASDFTKNAFNTPSSDSNRSASDTAAPNSNHNLSVTGEIIVGTVIPGLAILVAVVIGIDQRRRMKRGQGNVVNVFLDGTRRLSRQRPSPTDSSRRTWPGH